MVCLEVVCITEPINSGRPSQSSRRAVTTSSEAWLARFNRDPEGAVTDLQQMLQEDLKAFPPRKVEEYNTAKLLNGMSEADRSRVGRYIFRDIPLRLSYPGSAVRLADAQSKILRKFEKCNRNLYNSDEVIGKFTFSTNETIVLLYSIQSRGPRQEALTGGKTIFSGTARKDSGTKTLYEDGSLAAFTRTMTDQLAFKPRRQFDSGEGSIVLYADDEATFNDPAVMARMRNVYDLARQFNSYIPDKPLKSLAFSTDLSTSQTTMAGLFGGQAINIQPVDLDRDNYLAIAAHELGHALFNNKGIENDRSWGLIFQFAKVGQRFELVDDSNFLGLSDNYGHPYDDASELFASTVAAYSTHPEKLIAFINDVNTPADMKRFGLMAWCYLRDRVFNGKVFSGDDPFRSTTFDSLNLS